MSRTAKYQVAVWTDGDPEPSTATVVIAEEWGSSAAFIGELENDLRDLKADGEICRYQITPQDCDEMQPEEIREWVSAFRKDGDL